MDILRQALRRLAKAVVVITTIDGDRRLAMAATAVSELSFDPPSMLICVNRTASLHDPLSRDAPFAINILHQDHAHIANQCSGAIKGEERFAIGDWRVGALGVPFLADAQATIICRQANSLVHGTHSIFVGDVVEVLINGQPEPLVYVDGRYTQVAAALPA